MMWHLHRHANSLLLLCAVLGYFSDPARAEIEYNTISEDGSFQFRYIDV